MSGLQAVTITSAFVFGTVLALLGSIKLPLAKRLGIDDARVGGLLSALNLALMPMMFLSGVLIDRVGVRAMLIAGCLVTALAIFGLTYRPSYRWALAAIVLVGVGGAFVCTGSVVLMPYAFGAQHQPAAGLNLGMVFFGLGALITPALADVLLRTLDFRRGLGLLAAVCLVPAALAAVVPFEQLPPEASHPTSVFRDWYLWLTGLVFFLYGPLEGAFGAWATTYLTQMGYSERRAAWWFSGFWLTFLGGRLLVGFLQYQGHLPAWSNYWLIPLLALLAAVLLGHLAGAPEKGRQGAGLLLLGAALGPIFPTLVGIVFEHFPKRHGTAFGSMYALGCLGSLFLPPLIGAYARRRSVQHALYILMGLALALMVAAVVLVAQHLRTE
jgi:fucose permease